MHRFLGRLARELRHGILPIWILEELDSAGPTYGYQLLLKLNARAGPGPAIGPSTLYPTLARLRRAGCVEVFHGRESRGPVRKYYRITPAGRTALAGALDLAARVRAPAVPVTPAPTLVGPRGSGR